MKKVIVANWKMHKTIEETLDFITDLEPLVKNCESKILLAVPSTAIWNAANHVNDSNIMIGAQNIDFHSEGAFTGEISAKMVKDAGAKFVIVGHSERRKLFHESSEIVNLKVKAALSAGIQAILCVGETYEERMANAVENVLKAQLIKSLEGITRVQLQSMMISYEPIWAIGTGLAATPKDVFLAHRFCRQLIEDQWGQEAALETPLLYGGSVKADNARELLDTPEIDGLLVGGASLSVDSFCKIIFSQQAVNLS